MEKGWECYSSGLPPREGYQEVKQCDICLSGSQNTGVFLLLFLCSCLQ